MTKSCFEHKNPFEVERIPASRCKQDLLNLQSHAVVKRSPTSK